MKKFKINSEKSPSARKLSREESLTTWHDINERKTNEAKETVSNVMSDLLNNIEMIVYGEVSEKSSSCSFIQQYSSSLEVKGNKLLDEDPRLANWKKWIKIRQKESKKIAKATLRHHQELLLNSNPNDYREIMKEKEMIEKSRVNVGDVRFWRMPEKMKNNLYMTIPRNEKCCPPTEITFTQTPDVILKEQNIRTRDKSTKQTFFEIADKKISYYVPQMEKLVVCPETKRSLISFDVNSMRTKSEISVKPKSKEHILVINGLVLDVKNEIGSDILIDLIFNGFKYEKHSKVIKLENLGEVAINFNFEKFKIFDCINFLKLPSDQAFFFDKLPFRLVPGETKLIQFNFFATNFGVFNEKWKLICDPPFMGSHSVVINCLGYCEKKYKRSEFKLIELKEEILRKSAEQNIKEEIQNILSLAKSIGSKKQCRELFVDSIREKFLEENPNLNYHAATVDILSEIYEEVNESECEWNYNVNDLYQIILNIHVNDGEDDDDGERQKIAYHRFNDAIQKLMRKITLNVEFDEKMLKYSLIKTNFAIFFEKFETEMEITNDITSIKRHLLNALNKMISILES